MHVNNKFNPEAALLDKHVHFSLAILINFQHLHSVPFDGSLISINHTNHVTVKAYIL